MGLFPWNLPSGNLIKLILNIAVDLHHYKIMFLQQIKRHNQPTASLRISVNTQTDKALK